MSTDAHDPHQPLADDPAATGVEAALTDTRFTDFDLHPLVLQGLEAAGFTHCTPIQAGTLPIALSGRDVTGQAQTGTGKTAAFLLAIFQRLLEARDAGQAPPTEDGPMPLAALVLAPTRELAIQIHRDAEALNRGPGLRLALAYGGVDYDKQRDDIAAGADVLIGTPGRIIDYLKQGVFTLNQLRILVLDEADRMFDLGFIKDIRYLMRRSPPPDQRQSLLFSATLSHRVLELAYEDMNEPERVTVETEQVTADNIEERVYYPANEEKLPLLVHELSASDVERAMVFVNTRHEAQRVADTLRENGIRTALLSGNVPQQRRQKLLKRFTDGELDVLVGTDVAARGLHIPAVSHVINYDLPQSAEDYVHRVGRTARLGATGTAVSFACEHYAFHQPEIEEYIGHPLPLVHHDPEALPAIKRAPRRPPKGRGGHAGRGGGRRGGGGGGSGGGAGGGGRRRQGRGRRGSSA
jgi:ATP-dependent RNA helicase RhlB